MSTWFLAIDFGTSNTSAVTVSRSGAVPVGFGSAHVTRMPSGVMLKSDGGLLVGVEAERQATIHPDRYEPAPKRSIGQASLLLGDSEIPVVVAVAAVLSAVVVEARRQNGGTRPAKVALTYPARWGAARQAVLRDAATRAGLGDVLLVSEPEAAAVYFARQDGLPIGRPIAVYDLGGGTLDVAVLTATPAGFQLIGRPGGIDPLGGDDVDGQLLHLVLDRVRATVPAAPGSAVSVDVEPTSHRVALRREIRRAKEDLAATDSTELIVPGVATPIALSRADLRVAAGMDIEASVEEFVRTVQVAGVAPSQLAGVYLAGGSSRLPLVRESLRRRLPPEASRVVRTLHDPKLAVALGAAEILHTQESEPVPLPSGLVHADRARRPSLRHQGIASVMAVILALVGGVVWLNFRDSNVVAGTVHDSLGEPMGNLQLLITSGSSQLGGKQIETMTDDRGRYKGKLPRGSYKVEAYGTVAYEGREVMVRLSPKNSAVLDLPASGGATLDLEFRVAGQRPDTTGVAHADYFGGSVEITEAWSFDQPLVLLAEIQPDPEVTFHFEPTGPLVDGTPSQAFDVTRTVGQLTSGSGILGQDHVLEDIPLGSYVLTATLETPSGPIPLMFLDADFEFTEALDVPLAALCPYGCFDGASVRVPIGIDPRHL